MKRMKWAIPTVTILDFSGVQGVKGAVGTIETQGATSYIAKRMTNMDIGMGLMLNATSCVLTVTWRYECIDKGFKQAGTALAHRRAADVDLGIDDNWDRVSNKIHLKGISSAQAPS